jgi:hypothetical protein
MQRCSMHILCTYQFEHLLIYIVSYSVLTMGLWILKHEICAPLKWYFMSLVLPPSAFVRALALKVPCDSLAVFTAVATCVQSGPTNVAS